MSWPGFPELNSYAIAEFSKSESPYALKLLQEALKVKEGQYTDLPSAPKGNPNINFKMVSLNGIKCSGKTTLTNMLAEELKKMGFSVEVPPRFYDCVPAQIIFEKSEGNYYEMYNPITDSLIIASAYVHKLEEIGKLGGVDIVLCDRGIDSLIVCQGKLLENEGYSLEEIVDWQTSLIKGADNASIRFLLEINPGTAMARCDDRYEQVGKATFSEEYITNVGTEAETYQRLMELRDYIRIDADQELNEIAELLLSKLRGVLS